MSMLAAVLVEGAGSSLAAEGAAYALTSGRIWSVVAAVAGLSGIASGWRALARPDCRIAGTTAGRWLGAALALGSGVVALAVAAYVVVTADAGIGTGSGLAGAYLAAALGVAALVLGGVVLGRSRRAAGSA
ncbi:DUF6223 family protein [Antribacter gilvus]|uniref:DUF6223 family protein n=1 Tax=Antribacter gilvus TaxID=2304675 RepID=UPI00197FBFE5|nr:DUF6223 family protein [Antribacter gilvus]